MIRKDLIDRAIRTWARRHSGIWQPTDEAELQTWLAEAAEHRQAYERVALAWDAAGELQYSPPGEQRRAHQGVFQPSERRGRSITRKAALAACIALLAFAGTLSLWTTARRWWNGSAVHLVTLMGRPAHFVLDDGTQVLLDADTELIAHIGFNRRQVTLVRGEARFNVLHDVSRPFEVTAGFGRVQDLGTHFDIETLSDATRVSVLEGRVAVLTAHGRTLLVAGQAGGYDESGNLDPVRPVDATNAPGLAALRHFDRERLGDVLERLARYHPVTFLFEDRQLRDLRVSGTFKTGDLDLFLRTLASALPIEPRYLAPHQIEITSRRPHPNLSDRMDGTASAQH